MSGLTTAPDEEVDTMSNDQLVAAMLRAKNERRRAESDVQLLANRLAHLRAEEEKARKKIEETKKRAGEILEMKERNAAIAKRKASLKKWRDANRDHYREKCREYAKNHAKKNPEKIKQKNDVAMEFRRFRRILL